MLSSLLSHRQNKKNYPVHAFCCFGLNNSACTYLSTDMEIPYCKCLDCDKQLFVNSNSRGRQPLRCLDCIKHRHCLQSIESRRRTKNKSSQPVAEAADESRRRMTRKQSRKFAEPDSSEIPTQHFAATAVMVVKMSWRYSESQLTTLRTLLQRANWDNLQGASKNRWFIRDMPATCPALHLFLLDNIIGNKNTLVRGLLKALHPKHVFYSIGALKTASSGDSTMQGWHTDYTQSPSSPSLPHLIPFSVIITLEDECVFCYIDANTRCKIELIVPPFHFVRFMGNVVHCGGKNRQDREVYRIFMYCTSCPGHIPVDSFFAVEIDENKCACGGSCFKN